METQELRYDALPDASPGIIDKLPVAVLVNLQREAEAHAASAAQVLAILHAAMVRRYATGLNQTGTSHRRDGDYEVTVTVPKTVDWDQAKLASAIEHLRSQGENPAEYVETKLTVQERKYSAWPQSLRDLFEPARTVKSGKAKFAFAPAKAEAA